MALTLTKSSPSSWTKNYEFACFLTVRKFGKERDTFSACFSHDNSVLHKNSLSWSKLGTSVCLVQLLLFAVGSNEWSRKNCLSFQFIPSPSVKFNIATVPLLDSRKVTEFLQEFFFSISKMFSQLGSLSWVFSKSENSSGYRVRHFGLHIVWCVWGENTTRGNTTEENIWKILIYYVLSN
jgi:hypothetical protein